LALDTIISVPDAFKDPYSFEEIITLHNSVSGTVNPVFNLSKINFIEPYSLLGLLLFGRNYLRASGQKIALSGIPFSIHQYLIRMDFFKKNIFHVVEQLDPKYFLKRNSVSRNLIEITEIPTKERQSISVITGIIALFRKRADHILKYWVSTSIIDYFVTVISEICQNIFEHSLDSGYLAMQTYSMGTSQIARLVIADSGIGIRESFSAREELASLAGSHVIEKALTTPISSKRRFGYGLCQVNAIIEKLKGSIYIRSGESSATVLHKQKQSGASHMFLRDDLAPFPGTQISISLFG